jgi:hypothetical protein
MFFEFGITEETSVECPPGTYLNGSTCNVLLLFVLIMALMKFSFI